MRIIRITSTAPLPDITAMPSLDFVNHSKVSGPFAFATSAVLVGETVTDVNCENSELVVGDTTKIELVGAVAVVFLFGASVSVVPLFMIDKRAVVLGYMCVLKPPAEDVIWVLAEVMLPTANLAELFVERLRTVISFKVLVTGMDWAGLVSSANKEEL